MKKNNKIALVKPSDLNDLKKNYIEEQTQILVFQLNEKLKTSLKISLDVPQHEVTTFINNNVYMISQEICKNIKQEFTKAGWIVERVTYSIPSSRDTFTMKVLFPSK